MYKKAKKYFLISNIVAALALPVSLILLANTQPTATQLAARRYDSSKDIFIRYLASRGWLPLNRAGNASREVEILQQGGNELMRLCDWFCFSGGVTEWEILVAVALWCCMMGEAERAFPLIFAKWHRAKLAEICI